MIIKLFYVVFVITCSTLVSVSMTMTTLTRFKHVFLIHPFCLYMTFFFCYTLSIKKYFFNICHIHIDIEYDKRPFSWYNYCKGSFNLKIPYLITGFV